MTIKLRPASGLCLTIILSVLFSAIAVAQMPQTATEKTTGAPSITTSELKGEVVYVEGNNLVVKMSTGEIRSFNDVPESRKFLIDGKEVGVRDLKPGTKLTATITTTSTPVTVRTRTVGSGKVFFVSGNNVILTLPHGENKQYKVTKDVKFNIEGKPGTVSDLRKGMVISAEKIVEEPIAQIASNTEIVGQAPPEPAPTTEPAPAPEVASAPAAPPTAEPAKEMAQATAPAQLPKTGSPIFLIGLLGSLLVGGSLCIRMFRRS